MGHSSLFGTDRAAEEPAGRDTALLGPSDSSVTGSDMAGIGDSDDGDPALPVDVAMRDDMPHAAMAPESLGGSASVAGGTGERRSAGLDAGEREAADIGVDRVFSIDGAGNGEDVFDEDEDPDLAFIDAAQASDPLDEEADADLADEDLEDDDAADAGERYAGEDDGIPGAKPTSTRGSSSSKPSAAR